MKLNQLTIHNIASIKDATIRFDAQPLSSSEVFLITGKTGAGKSTILDAICLALYADTPRLDSTNMQGNMTDQEKVVKVDDPFYSQYQPEILFRSDLQRQSLSS